MRTAVKEIATDRKVVLSTLWIVLMFNYLYCDVLGLNDPEHLIAIQSGVVAGIDFTPEFLLVAGVMMQIPIAMVLLSRVLRYRVNRWSNIIAAILMVAVQVSSLFLEGSPTPYYLFFSAIEIGLLLFAIGYAWKWTLPMSAKLPDTASERAQARSQGDETGLRAFDLP